MYALLKDTCPALFAALTNSARLMDRSDLLPQLERVVIAPQRIGGIPPEGQGGIPGTFSAMIYPWPRLTLDQRRQIELREHDSLHFEIGGTVVLDFDDFGQINWIQVTGRPEGFLPFQTAGRAGGP